MKTGSEKFLVDFSIQKAASTITNVEAGNDRDYLVEALEKAYPGKWAMKQTEWAQILKNLRALKFVDPVYVDSLGEILADELWPIPDGHLKVKKQGVTCGTLYKKYLRQPSTGANLANREKGEFWKFESKETPRGKIAILAISGFPQSSEPVWEGFQETTSKILTASTLIVDLRGNGGGDDTKASELVSALLGYELDQSWIRQIVLESAESYALQINTYERIIWENYKKKNEEPPAELEVLLTELKEKAQDFSLHFPDGKKTVIEVDSAVASGERSPKFKGDIFVLIDPQTVSSGEWASIYLKKLPQTKTVGENSYGMIHFGNTGYLQLPHSGLAVSLCMKINEFTDGSPFYEKTGLSPDIRITGKNSFDYVLDHLSK